MDVAAAGSGRFNALVDRIVESYRAEPCLTHAISGRLPNHEAIIEVIHLLRDILFPGYFGRNTMTPESLPFDVGHMVAHVRARLVKEIHRAMVHEATRCEEGPEGPTLGDAEDIADDFLATIPRLRAILATDAQAAYDGDPAATSIDEIIFSYPGFFAISVFRLAHELFLRQVPLIPRIMTEYAHGLTGIDIHPGATIDEYFFIDHGTGVVIGETTRIGRRVKIYQGVTLGALSTRGGQRLKGAKRHPTLEDDVTVYSGASVLGGETVIGAGAVISGNVFVTQSVPAHTRVSMKNPELQYKNQKPTEFVQEPAPDWVI